MNGPTFAATSAARPAPAPRPVASRPPHKPEADNPAVRILTYVRLHWLTILFAGALLGAALGYAAWTFLPPKYESTALFRVSQVPRVVGSAAESGRNSGNFTTVVKTYAGLIKYDYVYRYALREYRLGELPTLKAQKDPIKFLDEKLTVSSKEGSEIITLSLQGENPDDVRKIVDGIAKAYEKEVILKEKQEFQDYRMMLEKAKQTLEKQLDNLTNGTTTEQPNAVAGFGGVKPGEPGDAPRVDPAVKPAAAVGGGKGLDPVPDSDKVQQAMFGPLMGRKVKLEEGIQELQFKVAEARAEVDAIKAQYQKVLSEPAPADTDKAVRDQDPDVRAAMAKVDRLQNQYAQKLSVGTNPNSSALQTMLREIESAEIELEKTVREKVKQADEGRRKPRVEQAQFALDVAQKNLTVMEAKLAYNRKLLEDAKAELKAIPAPPSAEVKASLEREKPVTPIVLDKTRLAAEYTKVSTEWSLAELNKDSPSRIAKIQDASTAMQKDTMKQILGTVAAGLLGFVLVGAVCVGLEMRARKVSSLAELRATAPAPVVGVVPHAPDADTARDPIKRAEVNEAIDKLRAYVAQTWLSRGATTVAVTSPLGDEGKSFTAFGLASSLAQAGMKTLLVDFDLRNPTLHTYAGVSNDAGVCELLRGETDFRKTIQVLPNGLHFLSGGKWSDDARQAAVGGRLEALLVRLKEPFDCVVLHADALLTVAESVEVARRSEVLLLCALYRTTRSPLLKKAADRASAMEIPYTGVVYVGSTQSEALC
ncbi:MAG: hypothetical protein MUF18_12895 [Fimbriiglobus sp.]|nr:hypothetical protein [Fimbriiglobus sp.]